MKLKGMLSKMHVRPRNEIVALGLEDDVDPRVTTGKYYSPSEFKKLWKMMKQLFWMLVMIMNSI